MTETCKVIATRPHRRGRREWLSCLSPRFDALVRSAWLRLFIRLELSVSLPISLLVFSPPTVSFYCGRMRNLKVVAALLVAVSVCLLPSMASAQLRPNFYANICPNVENIVRTAVRAKFRETFVTVPATIRLFFHDCFVRVRENRKKIKENSTEFERWYCSISGLRCVDFGGFVGR